MLWVSVDKESDVPMIRQIYHQFRQAVLNGKLGAGSKLPSSRELAKQLHISRNVVLEAYDLLHAEGFLQTRKGAGTFIATGAQYHTKTDLPAPRVRAVNMGYGAPKHIINFRAGTPELSLFPRRKWLSNIRTALDTSPVDILAYGHPEGRMELREAICEYVVTQREVDCHPDQVIITAGTTQAIGLTCSLLLRQDGKQVVVEDPLTYDIKEIVANQGGEIHPVGVDNLGMKTAELPEQITPVCIYVTPSHQFPMGATLPIQRRIELLCYAEQKNSYVIEDDYDSEFRFDGPPISSLHGLAPSRVVYIGTFSKTLCPAIRIGYIVLPAELISGGRSRKWQMDLHNEVTSQLALAAFIKNGDYLKHVVKMRKHYLQRRKAVEQALQYHFGDQVEILGSSSGLHLVARFPDRRFTQELLDRVEQAGAKFYGVWSHCMNPDEHRDKLLIGYGNLTLEQIEKGMDILAVNLVEKDLIIPGNHHL